MKRTLLVKNLQKTMRESGSPFFIGHAQNDWSKQLQKRQLILLEQCERHDIGRVVIHHVALVFARSQLVGSQRLVHSTRRTKVWNADGDRYARAQQDGHARTRRWRQQLLCDEVDRVRGSLAFLADQSVAEHVCARLPQMAAPML